MKKVILVDNIFITAQIAKVVKPRLISMLDMIDNLSQLNLEIRIDMLSNQPSKAKFKQEFTDGVVLTNLLRDIEDRFCVKFDNTQVVFGHGGDGRSLEFMTTVKNGSPQSIILTSCFY